MFQVDQNLDPPVEKYGEAVPTNLEIYVRSESGETFFTSSLMEGLRHLLSEQGYRLSIYEYPGGKRDVEPEYVEVSGVEFEVKEYGSDTPSPPERVSIVLRRFGNQIIANIHGPGLSPVPPMGMVETEGNFEKSFFSARIEDKKRRYTPPRYTWD